MLHARYIDNPLSGHNNMTRQHLNILIIISDEHRKDAMGCAGHPIVKTPHLDGLAARGTCFTNAYTPSPMCVPTPAVLQPPIWSITSEGH